MRASSVFRWAAFEMAKVAQQTLDRTGVQADDLDLFVSQQLLRAARFGHAVRLRLGFSPLQYEVRTGDDLDVVEYSPVL